MFKKWKECGITRNREDAVWKNWQTYTRSTKNELLSSIPNLDNRSPLIYQKFGVQLGPYLALLPKLNLSKEMTNAELKNTAFFELEIKYSCRDLLLILWQYYLEVYAYNSLRDGKLGIPKDDSNSIEYQEMLKQCSHIRKYLIEERGQELEFLDQTIRSCNALIDIDTATKINELVKLPEFALDHISLSQQIMNSVFYLGFVEIAEDFLGTTLYSNDLKQNLNALFGLAQIQNSTDEYARFEKGINLNDLWNLSSTPLMMEWVKRGNIEEVLGFRNKNFKEKSPSLSEVLKLLKSTKTDEIIDFWISDNEGVFGDLFSNEIVTYSQKLAIFRLYIKTINQLKTLRSRINDF